MATEGRSTMLLCMIASLFHVVQRKVILGDFSAFKIKLRVWCFLADVILLFPASVYSTLAAG